MQGYERAEADWQTASTGESDTQADNLVTFLSKVGVNISSPLSLLGLGQIAALSEACTLLHCRVPGFTTLVKTQHQFARSTVTSPHILLEKDPFGHTDWV